MAWGGGGGGGLKKNLLVRDRGLDSDQPLARARQMGATSWPIERRKRQESSNLTLQRRSGGTTSAKF